MAIDTELIISMLPAEEAEVAGKYSYNKKQLVEFIEQYQNTIFGGDQYPQTLSMSVFCFVPKSSAKGVKKSKCILRIKSSFNNYGLKILAITLTKILKFLNAGGAPYNWPKSVDAQNFEFVCDHYPTTIHLRQKYSWVQDIINFNKQIQ